MKIGILTIHSALNYGAALQAFALSRFLQNTLDPQKYEVEMIDFRPSFLNPSQKIHLTTDIRSDLIELERFLLRGKHKHKVAAFDRFIAQNETLSSRCHTAGDLENIVSDYDILISGSDQIWNYAVTGYAKSYFLNFKSFSGKRIAFSSSFGDCKFNGTELEEVASFLKQFNFLSCRETDGCAFIEDLVHASCQHVCDPTILNDSEVYSEVAEQNIRSSVRKAAKEKYVLIYNLISDPDVFLAAQKAAEINGCKVYQIFPTLRKKAAVDQLFQDISPEEFLHLFKNAAFVITNSFHGTCFSILFSKNFYTIKPPRINRLSSMLGKLEIMSRVITDSNQIDCLDYQTNIDYEAVKSKLVAFRSDSIAYLLNAVADDHT